KALEYGYETNTDGSLFLDRFKSWRKEHRLFGCVVSLRESSLPAAIDWHYLEEVEVQSDIAFGTLSLNELDQVTTVEVGFRTVFHEDHPDMEKCIAAKFSECRTYNKVIDKIHGILAPMMMIHAVHDPVRNTARGRSSEITTKRFILDKLNAYMNVFCEEKNCRYLIETDPSFIHATNEEREVLSDILAKLRCTDVNAFIVYNNIKSKSSDLICESFNKYDKLFTGPYKLINNLRERTGLIGDFHIRDSYLIHFPIFYRNITISVKFDNPDVSLLGQSNRKI
ncbi:hypothetical protein Ciccas_008931, partial [Cichlidogyrus casuarinus]